ncbi:hypothetical protein P8452_22603 [Trifolium repens]|nr:hypothetical protein P8452_22603 [Trifolium repens]
MEQQRNRSSSSNKMMKKRKNKLMRCCSCSRRAASCMFKEASLLVLENCTIHNSCIMEATAKKIHAWFSDSRDNLGVLL